MEKKVLERLDRMIMKHELLLAKTGVRSGVVPDELKAQIERLETGLYALREGVHGFMKAKECGFPLENFDSYLESLEGAAVQAESLLSDAIEKLAAFAERGRSA
jgi:hypothetical protein